MAQSITNIKTEKILISLLIMKTPHILYYFIINMHIRICEFERKAYQLGYAFGYYLFALTCFVFERVAVRKFLACTIEAIAAFELMMTGMTIGLRCVLL